MQRRSVLGVLLVLMGGTSLSQAYCSNPPEHFKEIRMGAAVCKATDSTLIINTGKMKRTYRFTSGGLRTVSLSLPGETQAEWNNISDGSSDWDLGFDAGATWETVTARIDDDSGFTSKHITVVSELTYAGAGIRLRYVIWVYPESGMRTQIEMMAVDAEKLAGRQFGKQQIEYIPRRNSVRKLTAFGYYTGTQDLNSDSTPILKEVSPLSDTIVDWASGLIVQDNTSGFIIVKESHKCVNQSGVATGGFAVSNTGITVNGPGLSLEDLRPEVYKKCWATWIVPYTGGAREGRLALKQFDRLRYPVRKNDIYIMANTWGSTDSPQTGKYASREENVLKEIASQADLGIDIQQIDDGWQGAGYKHWRPVPTARLDSVQYDVYPDGWDRVKEYALRKGVKLGLWASWVIPENDMKWNYDQGGFKYFKVDFAQLNSKKRLDGLVDKVRSFILYTQHAARVNWDVTTKAPRVGYFYAREYGNIYLENRKPSKPVKAIYKPHLVLRDAWQIARYLNLNRFQITVQNVDRINRQHSDAYLYSNAYCTAISLMGSPVFFQQTQLYTQKDRNSIRKILKHYKQHRNEIYKGYVFPIGHIPDDSSWTGFQDVVSSSVGYLLIFRELKNKSRSQAIKLKFISNRYVLLTDIFTGEMKKIWVDKDGLAVFVIPGQADFRFYRYTVQPVDTVE